MPETEEVKKPQGEKDTDKVEKEEEDQPSCFFSPDDPLIRQYNESKKKLKEAAKNIMPDEDEHEKTVKAARSFAKKRSSSKIIKNQ